MPIDASIALGVKPAQQPDELEQYGKALSLKNMMQHGRLQQQQSQMNDESLRGAQLANTEKDREIQGEKALTDAIQANTKVGDDGTFTMDHDAIEGAVTRAGFPKKALEYNKTRLEREESAHKAITNQLDEYSKRSSIIGNYAQSILNAPPELRPMLYTATVKQLMNQKMLDPATMQKNGIPPEYQGPQTDAVLQQLSDSAQSDPAKALSDRLKSKRDEADEQRKQQQFDVEQPGREADAMSKNIKNESQLLGGAKNQADWTNALAQLPDERKSKYPAEFSDDARQQVAMQGVSPDTRAQLARATSPAELTQLAANGDKKAAAALKELSKYEINLESAKAIAKAQAEMGALAGGGGTGPVAAAMDGSKTPNEDILKGLDPGVANVVKQVSQYGLELTPYQLAKSPYWRKVAELASQYDPSFEPANYQPRQALRKDFESGKSATALRSLNTVAQHLDKLNSSIDKLDNFGGNTVLSTGANYVKNTIGSKKEQNQLAIDRDAVANELENAYRAGGGSEQGVKSWKENFSADNSVDVQKNGVKEAAGLVEGLVRSLSSQYEKGMGKPMDFNLLDPKARATFEKLGVNLDGIGGKAAPGKPAAAPPATPQSAPGAKVITPDLMARAKAANPNASDDDIIAALQKRGYTK